MKVLESSVGVISVWALLALASEQMVIAESTNQNVSTVGSDRVSTFDVKGVRLGMSTDEVKALSPSRSDGPDGGLRRVVDENVELDVTYASEPYGTGVCCVGLITQVRGVDRLTFAEKFRADVTAKYGKPTVERRGVRDDGSNDNRNYYAFWGPGDPSKGGGFPFGEISRFKCFNHVIEWNAKHGWMMKGRYLYARFAYNFISSSPEVSIVLFDTSPWINEVSADKEKAIKAAQQQKVDF